MTIYEYASYVMLVFFFFFFRENERSLSFFVALLQLVRFKDRDVITRETHPQTCLYIVLSGKLTITKEIGVNYNKITKSIFPLESKTLRSQNNNR